MAFLAPLAVAVGASAETAATIGTIGSVASAVGAGVSAIGAFSQGRANSQSAKYNAAIAANNATISRQNAERTSQEGEVKAAMAQQETRAKYAGILANQGASGVDVNSGSAVDVRSSAAATGELNAINIRANAARQAYAQQTDAAGYDATSTLDKSQAKNDSTAGFLNAGSTLLGGLGDASNNYTNFKRNSSINNDIVWDN